MWRAAGKEDLVITGKSGAGKSHILKSLALRACQQQMYVRYTRCVDLLDDLYAGLADGSYPARLKRWAAPDFLVIDDVGLGEVKKRDDEPPRRHTIFNLIDRRHGRVCQERDGGPGSSGCRRPHESGG